MEFIASELDIRTTETTAKFRMATPEDAYLDTFDHTKLSAINTCPTWGILRYDMHKVMPGGGRAMALEAGSAMHECFSFIRLVSLVTRLHEDGRPEQFSRAVWRHHGTRLFGSDRLLHIEEATNGGEDVVDVCKRGSIAVLDTSGFYDDPRDKRRTLSNLEECIYAYINRWRFDHPVWCRNADDPTADVGIEIPFDVVVDITGMHGLRFRLTGRIDGIHYDGLNRLTVHDNKTASRLGDAWSLSQAISHQYTGYCAAASVFTQDRVNNCEVIGLAIPMPRTYDLGGFVREPMTRHPHHYQRWVQWLVHTVIMTRMYTGDPYAAPKYTHSCNRYFRPCAFIPFCDAEDEEQHAIVNQMETKEWSPLDKPILDGVGNE